jgi:hypothetical protein
MNLERKLRSLTRSPNHSQEPNWRYWSASFVRALPDAEAKQIALSKVESWKRRDEFPKEFVTLPGESYPSSALVDACYTLLLAPKSAALK